MQILEPSVIGLRSARITLRSPTHTPQVTLFPMVHVGEAGFFAQVQQEAGAHEIVLLEGVNSPIVANLTRSYRWMRVRRLGLVVQPRFDAEATDSTVIRADLSGAAFDALWRRVPVWQRAMVSGAAPVAGLIRGLTLSRDGLARGLQQDDLTARAEIFAMDGLPAAMRHALIEARDARVNDVLSEVITARSGDDLSIAVVYGAAHMPAILRGLRALAGYVPVDSGWMTVFAARGWTAGRPET